MARKSGPTGKHDYTNTRNISDNKRENGRWVDRKNAAKMSGARLEEIKEARKYSLPLERYLMGERTDQRSLSILPRSRVDHHSFRMPYAGGRQRRAYIALTPSTPRLQWNKAISYLTMISKLGVHVHSGGIFFFGQFCGYLVVLKESLLGEKVWFSPVQRVIYMNPTPTSRLGLR